MRRVVLFLAGGMVGESRDVEFAGCVWSDNVKECL